MPLLKSADRMACHVALGLPLALLLGAYAFQYGAGLPPCEMCWWQRYPLFAAIGLAVVAMMLPSGRLFIWLAALAIAVSGVIGAFHAGVEYGWWEGLTACTVASIGGSGDPLAAILNAPLVRCDTAPWRMRHLNSARVSAKKHVDRPRATVVLARRMNV